MQNPPRHKRQLPKPRVIPRTDGEQHSFTSFKPLSPEKTQGTFSFSKFLPWKSSEPSILKGSPTIAGAGPLAKLQSPDSSTQGTQPREHASKVRSKISKSWSSPRFQRRHGPSSPTLQSRQLPQGYLNLSALLKRLSVAADTSKGDQIPQSYFKLKQYWMPDENCKECYECGEKFNTFRRRHHCRLCGQIFCYRCCNIEIPGELMGYAGGLRVCTYCNKIFQTYTQSSDMVSNLQQLQADIQAVTMETEYSGVPHSASMGTLSLPRSGHPYEDDQDKVSRKISAASSNSAVFEKLEQMEARQTLALQSTRSPFDAFGVCAAEADILKQGSLRDLWHAIMSPRSGLELQSHRFRLKTYQNCLVANDLVEWLVNHEKALSRSQAVVIGQTLLESGWLEPVPQTRYAQDFLDEYALYQPGPTAIKDQAGNPRRSLFLKGANPNDDSSEDMSENDDDDESAPQWFRQLQGYESGEELDMQESVKADPSTPASILNVPKVSRIASVKLLDLDASIGKTEEKDTDLSLKVNLDHFGEGNESNKTQGTENQGPTLALTTDVPPPPLENYVYNEGYPISSLRSSNTRKASEPAVLGTSAEEVLKGAMMAKRIGVNRRKPSETTKLRDDNDERLAMERLCEARYIHMVHLVEQLLQDAGLSLDWKEVILPLVEEISNKVSPDARNDDDMDIRKYVKFKKLPGGTKSQCQVIWGVGFTKNISNKKMCSSFTNPRILLLSCAIDYQRKENRLASLDSLVLQEYNFLKNFVARVAALRPNVLLVEKTVSRLAQDMLLQHGITLALNVKPEVIERVARSTNAAVLRSMEQLSRPQLGTCKSFGVEKYILKNGEAKTLMFLDGCPPKLGCTVTLRGGNSLVLARVKKIIQFLTYIAYSQRLETAFLMDEFALPEDPTQLFNDSSCSKDNDISSTDCDSQEQATAKAFQKLLDRMVLSSSPYVDMNYPLPHLLTSEGSKCAIRSLLPKDIYWSAKLKAKRKNHHLTEEELDEFEPPLSKRLNTKGVQQLSPHPLVLPSVVVNTHNQFIQGVIADFRSQGGRIQLKRNRNTIKERRKSIWMQMDKENDQKQDDIDARRKLSTLERDKNSVKATQFQPTSPVHLNKQIDCLDPNYHQRIAVLFSSYSSESNNSPRPCISPWAVFMEFYGRNDITLGGFLERYCFRPSYVCPNPNCDVPMVDHVRYFAHGNGSLYINMKNLESPIPGFQHTILTWSWCKECKQVTPIVPLSTDAWALSFAKYIELRFYGDKYSRRASVEPCGHSLHKQHYQYFAYANMVASFKYRQIKLFETAIPPSSISVNKDLREASYWVRDVHAISDRADTVFASIHDRLEALKAEKPDHHTQERDSKLMQFTTQLEVDSNMFSEQTQVVTKKVNVLQGLQNPCVVSSYDHLDKQDQISLGYVISDSLNGLKRILCEIVENWNNRLQDFIQAEKKRSNKVHVTSNNRDTKSSEKVDNPVQNQLTKTIDKEDASTQAQQVLPATSSLGAVILSPQIPAGVPEHLADTQSTSPDLTTNNKESMVESQDNMDQTSKLSDDVFSGSSTTETKDSTASSKAFVRGHRRIVSSPPLIAVTCSVPYGNPGLVRSRSDTDVIDTHAQNKDNSLLLLTAASSNPSIPKSSLTSSPMSDRPLSLTSGSTTPKPSENGESDSPVLSTDGTPVLRRRDKMKNIISSFLPGSTFQPIASSFPSHEHHLLPAGENVLVVVNEKEPSSIIAYALSTKEYNQKLCEIQVALGCIAKEVDKKSKRSEELDDESRFECSMETSSVITVDDSKEDFVNVEIRDNAEDENISDSGSVHVEIIEEEQGFRPGSRRSTLEGVDKVKFSKQSNQENYDEEDGQKQQCNEQQTENRCFSEFGFQPKDAGKDYALEFHIQMQFSYNVCRFYCNAYYADQFRNLRKHIFEDGEEKYIRSLAHSVVWRARGGKSGSTFSKTLDDRFVLKQMSRLELQSFVEFAPHYFQYMNKAITEKRSTLLAKIIGVYRIGFKNIQTNTTMRQDFLVMENLFYDRKIDKTFDLKGSMRSRYVQVSGGENDVLLDENLLEMIREYPIFIRPHSKAVLSKAIHNDTEFLAQHMVMDYSLLVGIDEMRSELVIGIIDFIRTFTWDKKLEMYVKSSGILGGQGKMPTVVSPELYRRRFTEAMHRYFLMVPDKWTGLGNDLD